jgi:hypothetical protein
MKNHSLITNKIIFIHIGTIFNYVKCSSLYIKIEKKKSIYTHTPLLIFKRDRDMVKLLMSVEKLEMC